MVSRFPLSQAQAVQSTRSLVPSGDMRWMSCVELRT